MKIIPLLLTLVIIASPVLAQDEEAEKESDKKFTKNIDSLRIGRIKGKNVKFTPFIAPSYSPELEFLVSAGGLITLSLQRENPLLSRSSIPFSIGYSSNGSINANIKTNFFGRDDKWRLMGDLWLKDMPDHYWGVGFHKGLNIPQSDTTTAYNRRWIKIYARLGFRVLNKFYIGPILDTNITEASNVNERMKNDEDYLAVGPRSRNSGLGILIQYDSRDFATNAYKGIYLDLDYIIYSDILAGENNFNVLELDYRQYVELKPRKVLAWEIRSRYTSDDAPWTEKSLIGSPWDLRGYYWGRFRDNNMQFILLEYRHMFQRKRPNKKGSLNSRSGFVLWTGQGTISPEINKNFDWIGNIGIGYRFEVQPRMNLRVDYGLGEDSKSIYFSFNEAF